MDVAQDLLMIVLEEVGARVPDQSCIQTDIANVDIIQQCLHVVFKSMHIV